MSEDNQAVDTEEKEPKSTTRKKVDNVTKDSAVTVVADSNPKRPSSAAYTRFQAYLDNKDSISNVADCLELGLTMGDIHYDFIHGSITVEGAEVVEYEPKKRGPRAESADEDGTETVADADTAEETAEEMF